MSYYETLCEIAATASILIKFGHDDILENQQLFLSFLNELGFRYKDKKLTYKSFSEMVSKISPNQKDDLIKEFMIGHEPIYRKLAMVTNIY